MLLTITNVLAPVFLVIALGWLLTRRGFLSAQALQDMNRLTYWVGLPCLLFHRIGSAEPEFGVVGGLLLVILVPTLAGLAAAWLVARAMGLPAGSHGTFMQGVFRGNLVFVGLPVVIYAFAGPAGANAEASALLIFGPILVVYNVVAVMVLLLFGDGPRQGVLRTVARGLLTNPILLASLGGLLVAVLGLEPPVALQRSLSAIGQMSLPLALLCIGGSLCVTRLGGSLRPALVGGLLKVSLLPLLGLLLARWLELSADHTRIALILLACPTATVSYVLARQLGGDESLASGIVVMSSLLCIPAMAVALALTG